MNQPDPGRPDDELLDLTHAWCNGALRDEDAVRLERRLLADAEGRAFFRRYLALDAALRDHGESVAKFWLSAGVETPGDMPEGAASPLAGCRTDASCRDGAWPLELRRADSHSPGLFRGLSQVHLRLAGALGTGLLVIAALAIVVLFRGQADATVIGTLEQTAGDVRVLGADGEVRTIAADSAIRSGDTVHTRGSRSSTAVVYTDGTRLTLVGDTSITCGDLRSGSVVVHQGTLAAAVQPRPQAQPMLLATPAAQMQVLGTRFLVEALAHRTDLSVTEGKVRLVRVRDGETVDVPNGKYAVVTERDELVVRDLPGLPVVWEADFEDGLPEGWGAGEFVSHGLPSGSRGGVKCLREEDADGTGYIIRSNNAWVQGLFAAGENSHMHITFKMEHPRWINVFLITRTSDPQALRFSGNYMFNQIPKLPAGRWHTVSIPLASFERIHHGDESLQDVVPFILSFSSDAPDRGLVIDRVWVTSDGPGSVEIRPVDD